MHRDRLLLTVRVGRVERCYDLVVVGEFAALWERHEVARRFEDHKTLIHPELGALELNCQVLFTEDQSQALLVLTAPPRTAGYEKLQLLAVLGPEHFASAERNSGGLHWTTPQP